MTYYTVIGKPIGNDDDNWMTIKAKNLDDALDQFKTWLIELNDFEITESDVEVVWVFKSETRPEPVLTPWD